jgi:RNA polymerase sigma-70 factor (ECF subfamily)
MDIESIYDEYFSVVYKYIMTISRNQTVAEDITQETFFKAMEKIDGFRGDSSIKVWLCQIAKNTYLNYTKANAKLEELPDEYGEPVTSIEEGILFRVDSKRAHHIIHNMKEPYKEVFSLRTFGELSFSDIGELFGKTESWARVTYHRARLIIKEEMQKWEK